MSEKKSMLIYHDYLQHFNFLSDEQIGKIVRGMLEYEVNGILPEFDETIMKMTFSFIKTNLDRDRAKFFERCSKNSENGRKGGRPPKNQSNEQTDTTDGQKEQTNTANAEYSQSQSLNDSDDTQKRKRHFSQTYGNM